MRRIAACDYQNQYAMILYGGFLLVKRGEVHNWTDYLQHHEGTLSDCNEAFPYLPTQEPYLIRQRACKRNARYVPLQFVSTYTGLCLHPDDLYATLVRHTNTPLLEEWFTCEDFVSAVKCLRNRTRHPVLVFPPNCSIDLDWMVQCRIKSKQLTI